MLNKNWLVYKIADMHLSNSIQKYAKGKLIDIGCGEKPYREMLKPYVVEHIGVDHEGTFHGKSNIDRFGTAYGRRTEKSVNEGELHLWSC
jgi:hypothetical protein